MKTKNKNAAFSSTLTADQKKHYKRSLVQSTDGKWYLFADETNASVRIMDPRELYKSWEDFMNRTKDTETLVTLHTQLFGKAPTAKEAKDQVELTVKVWITLCDKAEQRLDQESPGSNTRAKRTSGKLADRRYEVINFTISAEVKMPPQARTCMEFFKELAVKAGHREDQGIFEVPEVTFNEYVVANAERLKTRQDPWRIFQYYRPQLIQGGYIRLV